MDTYDGPLPDAPAGDTDSAMLQCRIAYHRAEHDRLSKFLDARSVVSSGQHRGIAALLQLALDDMRES